VTEVFGFLFDSCFAFHKIIRFYKIQFVLFCFLGPGQHLLVCVGLGLFILQISIVTGPINMITLHIHHIQFLTTFNSISIQNYAVFSKISYAMVLLLYKIA